MRPLLLPKQLRPLIEEILFFAISFLTLSSQDEKGKIFFLNSSFFLPFFQSQTKKKTTMMLSVGYCRCPTALPILNISSFLILRIQKPQTGERDRSQVDRHLNEDIQTFARKHGVKLLERF